MTREEAIEVLKLVDENASCDDCLYYAQMEDSPTNEDCIIRQALDMAIQALSQEPKYRMAYDYSDGTVHKFAWIDGGWKEIAVEPYCDDAISREDAIKALQKVACYSAAIRARMIGAIEDLPSVTQKSGKWIETEYHRWKCSVCREKGMSEWDNIHDVRTNFCPNCGARMFEPKEGEG